MAVVHPGLRREFGRRDALLLTAPGLIVTLLFAFRVGQQLVDPDHNYEMHRLTAANQRLLFAYLLGAAIFNFSFMGLSIMRLVRRLRDQARHDPLTGLLNRRALEQAADEAWERWRRGADGFAVLALDLDHFKRVNDAHGHLAGDSVLRQLGQRLTAAVRSIDTVARTGGEEFIVLVPQVGREGALAAAERLRQAIRGAPFELADGSLTLTLSVGVALAQLGDKGASQVIQRPDQALYHAKDRGRDRVWLEE